MKKILCFAAAIFCLSGILAQEVNYRVKGVVEDLPSPSKVYMFIGRDRDSAVVEQGRFELKGIKAEPTRAELIFSYGPDRRYSPQIGVFLEEGTVEVVADSSFSDVKVSGGSLNTEYNKLKELLRPFDIEQEEIFKQAPDSGLSEEEEAALWAKVDQVKEKRNRVRMEWVKENPSSSISLFAVKDIAGFSPDAEKVLSIFESLSPTVRNSLNGKEYLDFLTNLRSTSEGGIASTFSRKDMNGKTISLSDFKGRYVLLDFWGSWCGPCRASHPHLRELYAKYKEKGFEIIGIASEGSNSERARAAWKTAIAEDQINWVHILNDEAKEEQDLIKLYSITAFPTKVLLDKQGKIIYRGVGNSKEIDEVLKNVLK